MLTLSSESVDLFSWLCRIHDLDQVRRRPVLLTSRYQTMAEVVHLVTAIRVHTLPVDRYPYTHAAMRRTDRSTPESAQHDLGLRHFQAVGDAGDSFW